jgi:polar amino acid transport system substrate-binding protein
MKSKLVMLVAAATLGFGTAAIANPIKIGVEAEPYPPFSELDAAGNWAGWEIDILHAICENQKLECEVMPVAWAGIIPALTSGQIDVIISSMSITADRAKVIDFTDKYYVTPAAIAKGKDAGFADTSEGLAGKTIGVKVSTTNEAYARKMFGAVSTLKTYQTQDEANQDLAAGRLDAVVADQFLLQAFIDTDDGKACCTMEVLPYDNETLGAGVGAGIRKGENDLRVTFNKGIAGIRADGTYAKINSKYFAFDIFGN